VKSLQPSPPNNPDHEERYNVGAHRHTEQDDTKSAQICIVPSIKEADTVAVQGLERETLKSVVAEVECQETRANYRDEVEREEDDGHDGEDEDVLVDLGPAGCFSQRRGVEKLLRVG
jgi:hypothetical protein